MYQIILIIHFFEILALTLATIHFKKYRHSTERFFLYFLWLTIFVEALGAFVNGVLIQNNIWVYILFGFVSFTFFFYWYWSILKKPLFKKVIIYLSLLYVIIALKEMFTESWEFNHVSSFVAGAIVVIIASVLYFYELLNSDKVLNIKYNLRFWIATGLLLFNVGMVPFIVFSKEFSVHDILRNIILVSLNIILYSCYSLGFIWTKQERNQYS